MTKKKMFGLLLIIAGVILIAIALHWANEFARSRGFTTNFKQFFTNNPFWNGMIRSFGGTPEVKAPEYDVKAMYTQIYGIILIIIGALFMFIGGGKKKR